LQNWGLLSKSFYRACPKRAAPGCSCCRAISGYRRRAGKVELSGLLVPTASTRILRQLESLFVTSQQRAKKFPRGGLCSRAAKTEYSSWGRQHGFEIQVSVHRFPVQGSRLRALFVRSMASFVVFSDEWGQLMNQKSPNRAATERGRTLNP